MAASLRAQADVAGAIAGGDLTREVRAALGARHARPRPAGRWACACARWSVRSRGGDARSARPPSGLRRPRTKTGRAVDEIAGAVTDVDDRRRTPGARRGIRSAGQGRRSPTPPARAPHTRKAPSGQPPRLEASPTAGTATAEDATSRWTPSAPPSRRTTDDDPLARRRSRTHRRHRRRQSPASPSRRTCWRSTRRSRPRGRESRARGSPSSPTKCARWRRRRRQPPPAIDDAHRRDPDRDDAHDRARRRGRTPHRRRCRYRP